MNHAFDQINFLPEWYRARRRRRILLQRQLLLVAVMGLGMAWLWSSTRQQAEQLDQYHAALQTQLAATERQALEVGKLQRAKAQLHGQVRVHNRLARPVSFDYLTATINDLTPEAIALTQLDAEVVQLQRKHTVPGQVDETGRPMVRVESYQIVAIDLEGMAPSNVHVANYVGRLAACSLFRDVKMIYSRQGKGDDSESRQFRISMTVPLDRPYRFVPAQEVAHAD